jgi:hypothetical protein
MNTSALVFVGVEIFACLLAIYACIELLRSLVGGKKGKSVKAFPSIGLVITLLVSIHFLTLIIH